MRMFIGRWAIAIAIAACATTISETSAQISVTFCNATVPCTDAAKQCISEVCIDTTCMIVETRRTEIKTSAAVLSEVQVRDCGGTPVAGLDAAAFNMTLNGVSTAAAQLKGEVPTAAQPAPADSYQVSTLLLDQSGSVTSDAAAQKTVQDAALVFADAILKDNPQHYVALAGFAGASKPIVVQQATNDYAQVNRSIWEKLPPADLQDSGSTNLYGSIIEGLLVTNQMRFSFGPANNSVTARVVVFSDGYDTAGRATAQAAIDAAQRYADDVSIVAIGVADETDTAFLTKVATSGITSFADTRAGLVESFNQTAAQIANQANSKYVLGLCVPSRGNQLANLTFGINTTLYPQSYTNAAYENFTRVSSMSVDASQFTGGCTAASLLANADSFGRSVSTTARNVTTVSNVPTSWAVSIPAQGAYYFDIDFAKLPSGAGPVSVQINDTGLTISYLSGGRECIPTPAFCSDGSFTTQLEIAREATPSSSSSAGSGSGATAAAAAVVAARPANVLRVRDDDVGQNANANNANDNALTAKGNAVVTPGEYRRGAAPIDEAMVDDDNMVKDAEIDTAVWSVKHLVGPVLSEWKLERLSNVAAKHVLLTRRKQSSVRSKIQSEYGKERLVAAANAEVIDHHALRSVETLATGTASATSTSVFRFVVPAPAAQTQNATGILLSVIVATPEPTAAPTPAPTPAPPVTPVPVTPVPPLELLNYSTASIDEVDIDGSAIFIFLGFGIVFLVFLVAAVLLCVMRTGAIGEGQVDMTTYSPSRGLGPQSSYGYERGLATAGSYGRYSSQPAGFDTHPAGVRGRVSERQHSMRRMASEEMVPRGGGGGGGYSPAMDEYDEKGQPFLPQKEAAAYFVDHRGQSSYRAQPSQSQRGAPASRAQSYYPSDPQRQGGSQYGGPGSPMQSDRRGPSQGYPSTYIPPPPPGGNGMARQSSSAFAPVVRDDDGYNGRLGESGHPQSMSYAGGSGGGGGLQRAGSSGLAQSPSQAFQARESQGPALSHSQSQVQPQRPQTPSSLLRQPSGIQAGSAFGDSGADSSMEIPRVRPVGSLSRVSGGPSAAPLQPQPSASPQRFHYDGI